MINEDKFKKEYLDLTSHAPVVGIDYESAYADSSYELALAKELIEKYRDALLNLALQGRN